MQNEIISVTGNIIKLCAPQSATGTFDVMRIEQVLCNLLQNALKYGQGKNVLVTVEDKGASLLFSVKDDGMGISRKHQGRIFDRFQRAVNANEISGLGLGLFISQKIVKAHEGKIWVESELGKGSCFSVLFPKSEKGQRDSRKITSKPNPEASL